MDTRSVLVIDPDSATCALLTEILAPEGIAVACYTRRADALAWLARRSPSVILIAVSAFTPAIAEFIRDVQRSDAGIPIIMMSTSPDGWRWVRQLGLAGFLSKPFDIDHLLEVIQGIHEIPDFDLDFRPV